VPANVETMAYFGEVPWHEQGQQVKRDVDAEAMLKAAGLDWQIEKRPARGALPIGECGGGVKRYARYEIVRLPREGVKGEQEVVLGIVSDRYEPLQNREAFEFFDPIVDRETAFFETAGALGQGERVWVMAKMPEAIEVVRGDECAKYLLLSNTHTGQGSVTVKFTAVRVVCENTLMLALNDGQQALRVRHSRSMADRMIDIADLIAAANAVYADAAELFVRLAKIELNRRLLEQYMERVFPKSEAQKRKDEAPPKWVHVQRLLDETPDLQLAGVRGTLWAAYNAVTRFEDYRVVEDEVSDSRLNRMWFGSGADLKLMALQAARELAARN